MNFKLYLSPSKDKNVHRFALREIYKRGAFGERKREGEKEGKKVEHKVNHRL